MPRKRITETFQVAHDFINVLGQGGGRWLTFTDKRIRLLDLCLEGTE